MEMKCFECEKLFKKGDRVFYIYHGDQDDRVCESCARKLKHTDTAYAGDNVFDSNVSEAFGGVF